MKPNVNFPIALMILIIVSIVAWWALSGNDKPKDELDDGKLPIVTNMPDGTIHINRLDPSESVTLPFMLQFGEQETEAIAISEMATDDSIITLSFNKSEDVRFFANDDTEYLNVGGYGVDSPIDQYTIEVFHPDISAGCAFIWPVGDSEEPYRVVITPLGKE